jgi:hypothetical protein
MAIEEVNVGIHPRETMILTSCRSSALRSQTRRQMRFTVVRGSRLCQITTVPTNDCIVNQAVEYILSQPDGMSSSLNNQPQCIMLTQP